MVRTLIGLGVVGVIVLTLHRWADRVADRAREAETNGAGLRWYLWFLLSWR